MKKGIFSKLLVSILVYLFVFQLSGVILADTELTAWVHPYLGGDRIKEERTMWKDFADSFESENPGVTINIEIIPWANRTQKFLTAFSAGKGPDIFYLIPDHIQQFSSKDLLAPLDDLISPEVLNDFYTGALSAGIVDGSTYGAPILQTVTSYIYNLDLLKETGWDINNLPETWDEFYKMSEMVKNTGKYGRSMTLGNFANMAFYPWLWQAGGDVLNNEGNSIINSEATVKTLEYMKSLYSNNFVPRDIMADSHLGLFKQGYIAALFIDNAAVSNLLDNQPGFEWTIGPLLKDKEQVTFGTIGSLVISSQSKNKKEAANFIEHFVKGENLERFLNSTGYFPPKKSLENMFDDHPQFKEMVSQAEYVFPGVIHPMSREIGQVTMPIVQGVVSGNYTPSEGASKLDQAINSVLSK